MIDCIWHFVVLGRAAGNIMSSGQRFNLFAHLPILATISRSSMPVIHRASLLNVAKNGIGQYGGWCALSAGLRERALSAPAGLGRLALINGRPELLSSQGNLPGWNERFKICNMFTSGGKVVWGQVFSSYVAAVVAVWLAVLITLSLGPALKDTVTFFFCAVMISSWYGGLWPGLLTAFLSWVALDYYCIPPLYSLGVSTEELPDMLAFSATALFISWLNSGQRKVKNALQQSRDLLDARVRERTADLNRANLQLQSEIAERRAAEEGLLQAQNELARISRITTMGELTASIAHELNQPLGSIVVNGGVCLRWLEGVSPNLEEARQAVEAIIRDGTRASDVLVRTRKLVRPGDGIRERLDINSVVQEVIAWTNDKLQRSDVLVRLELQQDPPLVTVDRVQMQQVILNLVMNAIESMLDVNQSSRVLCIRTEKEVFGDLLVQVIDSGPGIDPKHSSRIFEPFYTTKANGIGMGLTISRSIIEAHGGRLWVAKTEHGSAFYFTLPIDRKRRRG
jgi:signal transduction histidine kinase